MTVVGSAFIEILPEMTKFTKQLEDGVKKSVDAATSSSQSGFDKLAGVGEKAFLGLTAGAVAFGAVAIKTALDAEQAQVQLNQAIINSGASVEAFKPQIEDLSNRFVKFGYNNEQVNAALARLVQITGNTSKSVQLMGTVANLAAARHIDLATAATLVGKASEGLLTPLKRLGIIIQDTGSTAGNAKAALDLLNERFGGAAQAQADTYAGKLAAFRAEVTNLTEKVGAALLPVLARLLGIGADVINFFEHDRVAALALGTVVAGTLVPALGAFAATKIAAAAASIVSAWTTMIVTGNTLAATMVTIGFSADAMLGPIGLAIFALGALASQSQTTADILREDGQVGVEATAWVQSFVQGLTGTSNAADVVQAKINDLKNQIKALQALPHFGQKQSDEYTKLGGEILLLQDELVRLKGNHDGAAAAADAQGTSEADLGQNMDNTKKAIDAVVSASAALIDNQLSANSASRAAAAATKALADSDQQLSDAHDSVARTQREASKAQAEYDALVKVGGADVDKYAEATRKLRDLTISLEEATNGIADAQDNANAKQYDANVAIGTYGPKSQEAIRAATDLRDATVNVDVANNKLLDTKDDISKAHKDQADAASGSAASLERLATARDKLQSSDKAARDAVKAESDLRAKIPDLVDAQNKAYVDLAKANATYTDNQKIANGIAQDAIDKNADFRTELSRLESQLAPDSPLRANLDGYISQLQDLTGAQLTLAGGPPLPVYPAPVSGGLKKFAEGGWVGGPPGVPVPAIVHGGEFVLSRDMIRGAVGAPTAPMPPPISIGPFHNVDVDPLHLASRIAFEFVAPTVPA